jgi:hypothetical protein
MGRVEIELVEPVPDHRLRWWKEFVLVALFYSVYSLTRNQFGSARVDAGEPPLQAYHNALRVIRLERWMGLFVEPQIQAAFLGWQWFIRAWNVYYGTLHFVVTIVAFIWLFIRNPGRFTRYRNVLAFTTALAIIGFSLFPLMPPRLLDEGPTYGGRQWAVIDEAGRVLAVGPDIDGVFRPPFGFVDTLAVYGGLWSFDSGTMKEISNQYAAMPSLHTAWAVWSAMVMWLLVRRRWARALVVLYPVATVFCIIVTGNHFWLDGVGGLVCLAVGYALGRGLDDWNTRRIMRRHHEVPSRTPIAA